LAQKNNNVLHKCPHCACIFLTEGDLQKHLAAFGDQKAQHEYEYKKIHGKLEHGYSDE
jgi:Zn-finger nucleic acid-binding protein